MTQLENRRAHPRHTLTPMYAPVTIQVIDGFKISRLGGHAYDVSEGGVRIELDVPLAVGQPVAVLLDLPGMTRTVFARAEVVWVNDEMDDPGPRRMALRFSAFSSTDDRLRLLAHLGELDARRAA